MNEKQTKTSNDTSSYVNKENFIGAIRKFHYLTFVGLGLIFVFIIFCFITDIVVRWWLMVPIFIGSVAVLLKRKNQSLGLEKKVCIYGIWVIIVIFIIRDILISHKIAILLDGFRNATGELQKIFE